MSCHDASFAAGLLEACVQAVSGNRSILLVAYDLPYPEPHDSARRIETSFGVGFVVSPAGSDRALAELTVRMTSTPSEQASRCADYGLEAVRRGNPAARCLPLLAMLAARWTGRIRLDLSRGTLEIDVVPC